eukprot:Platyproteum_vivax@DN3651_c0_g1_i2.p1
MPPRSSFCLPTNASMLPPTPMYDSKDKPLRNESRRSTLPVNLDSDWAKVAQKAALQVQKVIPEAQRVVRSLSMPSSMPVDSNQRLLDDQKGLIQKTIHNNRYLVPLWIALAMGVYAIYHLFSDGDFSFLLTLSSIVSTFSFGFLLMKVCNSGSVGVSVKMLHCFQLVTAARLSSILFFNGYLPYDRSGNVVYRVSEVMGFVMCTLIYFVVKMQQKAASNNVHGAPPTNPEGQRQLRMLIMGAIVMAFCFHLTLNKFFVTDIAWAFALYLEAIAVLPQLILFFREKKVDTSTTHFLFSQACSKCMAFTFWLTIYNELNRFGFSFVPGLAPFVGYFVMLMQLAQLLLMGDFVVTYIRAMWMGVPIDQLLHFADNV